MMELKLVVVGGKHAGMEIPIASPKFLIGRGDNCHLHAQSKSVSRKHCMILVLDGTVAIEDVGSTNGTIINGEKISQRRELKDGDRITIGVLEFDVRLIVSTESKKKPKVHSVQEAAARTVATAAKADDDLDISSWLDTDDDSQHVASPLRQPVPGQDTTAGKTMDDTMTLTTAAQKTNQTPAPQKPGDSKSHKIAGQFHRPAKPMADNSGSAARDMLRQFFPRKKS
jgi:pSer/pThr/pTyr-binding forkhead associated (FHA) protein